jgi:V-type H+-transporting ATPase subunit E
LFILVTMNSSGGIVLASQDGKIVCDNTLDARLNVSFRQKLPEVRGDLLAAGLTYTVI